MEHYYQYYLNYYLQAGLDASTAATHAVSAMAAAGYAYTPKSSHSSDQESPKPSVVTRDGHEAASTDEQPQGEDVKETENPLSNTQETDRKTTESPSDNEEPTTKNTKDTTQPDRTARAGPYETSP